VIPLWYNVFYYYKYIILFKLVDHRRWRLPKQVGEDIVSLYGLYVHKLFYDKYCIPLHRMNDTTVFFNVHGFLHRKNILIYVQQDEILCSLFYLETVLHVLGGTTTHHQERKQLCLQHLVFATPLLLPAAIAAGSSNGVANTRCCRYSCLRSWWWLVVPPETCRAVSR